MKFVDLVPARAFSDAIEALSKPEKLVVCGSLEDKEYIEEALAQASEPTARVLERSLEIDVASWFETRRRLLGTESVADIERQLNCWPALDVVKPGFSLAHDMMSGELSTQLVGAWVQADAAWKLPAYFNFGGWNACPEPDVQCAIWRYWEEKYGAHIVAVSNDVIEAYVERPPQTQVEALELAWQQYLYCADIVDQGLESVVNLAASLVEHNVWFFWWD